MVSEERKAGRITYYLTRKRVKNINLRIRQSDGTVQVSAPFRVSADKIDAFVLSNEAFVLSALNRLAVSEQNAQRLISHRLNDGDKTLLLGKLFTIRHLQAQNEAVFVDNDTMTFALADKGRRFELYEDFLDRKRQEVFNASIDRFYPIFEAMGIARPRLIFKTSVSRWGYCQAGKGIIMMNRQLVFVPLELIDYLALHELTHLVYQNHSADYWHFMQKIMYDCKIRRKKLQSYNFLLQS